MNKKKKALIEIIIFAFILSIVLYVWNYTFKFKYGDGIYDLTTFYSLEDDTVDILILGSSHAFENINTGVLWDDYGYSSFILGGSQQPMWNTYYYLKEALKTQNPKLIILEGYYLLETNEYTDDSRIIKNNYGLRISKDKIDSLIVSTPSDKRKDIFLGFIMYHNRYGKLEKSDFLKYQGNLYYNNWKGFGCNMATTSFESKDISYVNGIMDLQEKTEEYYKATIDLAQKNEIPIIVVISPYVGMGYTDQCKFNRGKEIAEDKNVPFLNFNYLTDDIGLDYSKDFADRNHLNYLGNQKYTHYLGAYIDSKYSIPDHRGDIKYQSWDDNSKYLNQMIKNNLFRQIDNIETLVTEAENSNYWVLMSANNCNRDSLKEELDIYLQNKGIIENYLDGVWLIKENPNDSKFIKDKKLSFSTYSHNICMKYLYNDNTCEYEKSINIDKKEYVSGKGLIEMVVYDPMTEELVDYLVVNDKNEIIR